MRAATIQKISLQLFGLFFAFLICSVSSTFAQEQLGDVAREARDRRADQSRGPHVYTNEDLAQPKIVIRRNSETTSVAESPAPAVSDQPETVQNPLRPSEIVWPDEVPLGDIARFYRRQREVASTRDAEFASSEPPVLDMDFLLPSPFASPLVDFSRTLSPIPFIPEPVWEPAAASSGTIQVRPGDSLWKIAERHLGRGEEWGIIAAANPELKDPNRIQAGQQLRLPASEASSISPVSLAPSSEHVVEVQSGDSLWKLASAQMGSGYAWNCLAAANPQIENVNRIYPGQLVVIPASCPASA